MDIPLRFHPTQTIAPETFLVRQLIGEEAFPECIPLNTMVIRGSEPVVVDTGANMTADEWVEQTFAIVDPTDVRWVYLSHDDGDHTGSLHTVMEMCPNATLVANWFSMERMGLDGPLPPLDRLRIVNPGESFVAGDRTLTALVPPIFDSPTTRGLYDSKTGVYWGADAFGTAMPHAVDNIDELEPGYFRESFLHLQRLISPWHQWLAPAKYEQLLDSVRSLRPTVAVGAHGVALHGAQVESAFHLLDELPHLPAAPLVSHADFEAMLAAMGADVAGVDDQAA